MNASKCTYRDTLESRRSGVTSVLHHTAAVTWKSVVVASCTINDQQCATASISAGQGLFTNVDHMLDINPGTAQGIIQAYILCKMTRVEALHPWFHSKLPQKYQQRKLMAIG